MFLALAYVMPFLTGQIPQVGSMLCPMHIPVLLCGFFCGAPWGLAVGFVAPLLRSFTLGMPPMFPTAFCMAFELAAYGFVRCHKGFAVNVRHIKSLHSHEIVLDSGRIIPIGRVYKQTIWAAYENHIRKSNITVNSHLEG